MFAVEQGGAPRRIGSHRQKDLDGRYDLMLDEYEIGRRGSHLEDSPCQDQESWVPLIRKSGMPTRHEEHVEGDSFAFNDDTRIDEQGDFQIGIEW